MEPIVVNNNFKSEEYFINMGPQHPATHGVLRLLLTIDGEIIKKVEPDLGYIHRSIEKMCERDSYQQIFHLNNLLLAEIQSSLLLKRDVLNWGDY